MERHEPTPKGDAARGTPSPKTSEPASASGRIDVGARSPAAVARLQRLAGNRAVATLLAAKEPADNDREPERSAVVQTLPTVTAVVVPAAVGVGKSVTVKATAAGVGKLTWTLVGAPPGVTITPVGARNARITATVGSLAGAGTAFTVKAALAATPGDNVVSGAVALAGVKALAFTPSPAFPAIAAPMGATGPANTGEPNRDGVVGNTVTVVATTAPAGRPVTLQLPAPIGATAAALAITPGATTGKLLVRAKDDGTGATLDKSIFINPVAKKVSKLGPQTAAGTPYGALNLVGFSASDAASPLTRGVGETITAGGVDDLGLVPVVNGGPNPNPKLPTTVSATFWNDQNTTPAANAIVKNLVDVNKFVGPGAPKPLPAVTKFRQGFHWLSWTGPPNYSSEIDVGFHRRSLVKAGAGFQFVTEQVFPAGAAPVKKDGYAGNPLIKFTALTVAPKVPAAAGGLAADGFATADVTMVSSVPGRNVNWFLVSGPISFTGGVAALPLVTPANVQGGTVPGPAKVRGEDTKFPNRQFTGVVPLKAVAVSALAGGLAKVPVGTLATTFTFNAAPGGRTITPTLDAAATAAGVTAVVATPGGAPAAARNVTVTRPAAFTGNVTVTVTDSKLAAQAARRTFKFL